MAVPLLAVCMGLMAWCICQPQGFPASTALPGIEFWVCSAVVNPEEKKRERGRGKCTPFSHLWYKLIRYRGVFWRRQEVRLSRWMLLSHLGTQRSAGGHWGT